MTGNIQSESKDGITTITLARPDKLNAFNSSMAVDLEAAWDRFNQSDDRVAVLTGAGKSFTAGADLKDMPSEGYGYVPGIGIPVEKPIICAVQGWCVGLGLLLVMQSDLCVAGSEARFLYPEAKLGLGRGLMASLATRVPQKIATEVMLLAEPVSAQRMETHGLVNQVLPEDQVMPRALAMAQNLAERESVINEFYKYTLGFVIPQGPGEIAENTRWRSNHLPGHRPG